VPEKEFKVGDIVRLKSGGPKMTVTEIDDEEDLFHCRWFADNKQPENGLFEADTLELAETSPVSA